MDTGKPGKTRTPRRDGRPGSGLLIRPHVGAETRVKSGGRAERSSSSSGAASSDQPSAPLGDRTGEESDASE